MANIVIKDLEMDKELDNVSLKQIVGGWVFRYSEVFHYTTMARRSILKNNIKATESLKTTTSGMFSFVASGRGRPPPQFMGALGRFSFGGFGYVDSFEPIV